jgi:Ice-binding-like/Divergent InlB B-repeat domain/Bacterial Ig-like domain
MNKKPTLNLDGTTVHQNKGYLKIYKTFGALLLLFTIFITGCKKDEFAGEVVGLCPTVTSDPMDKAVDVVLDKVVTITFNTPMNAASVLNSGTFTIKQGNNLIAGTVASTTNAAVFTFKPTTPFNPYLTYEGRVTTAAKDTLRTAMAADYVWTFTSIPRISLTANPTAGGIPNGAGNFAQGSTTTVTATALPTYVFINWTENGNIVSTSTSYTFKVNGNRSLVANFALIPVGNSSLSLSSSPAFGGNTTGSGAYPTGSRVTATAMANSGYTFVNWTDNNVVVSSSSSYQFTLTGNRSLVANFRLIPSSQFALILSSSPAAGGTTDGEGAYNAGQSVTATAVANTGYTFTNWTENGAVVSNTAQFIFPLNGNRTLVANFRISTFTLIVNAENGTVTKTPNQLTYNYGTDVVLTAQPNQGYRFSFWSGNASGTVSPITVDMIVNKNITANFVLIPTGTGQGPILPSLGLAGNYAILTESGITTTGTTSITGNLGVSPIAATAITGFGLIMDSNGQSSTTPIVTGKVYASDYAAPTPANLTTAISNMETAYTTSNGLTVPAPVNNLGAGDISGRTIRPGLYKFTTGLLISSQGVTLDGDANDTWIFTTTGDLTVNSNAKITLGPNVQAKNIYWVVDGQALLDTGVDFSGIILSKNLISLKLGAKVNGRLLGQKNVTLIGNTVTQPQ